MPTPSSHPTLCFINLRAYHIFNSNSDVPTGGAEIALFELAPTLASTFTTTIITGDFGQARKLDTQNITLLSSLRLTNQHPIIQVTKLWKALHEANADIYIESVFGKTVFFTWIFCKLHKKNFIYTTASDSECDGTTIQRYPIMGIFFKIALEYADIINVSVAHHEAQLRLHHPSIKGTIVYIPHGMASKHNQAPLEKKTTILWVARCEPWKNPLLFIELAKKFPNEQFVMISAPQEGKMKLFTQVKKQASIVKNIHFIDGIPHRKISSFLKNAKLTVNTSDFEGYSMAFMQSGLAGIPMATLTLNPDSIITTHNLGTCAHGDFELLAQQIQMLLDHPEELRIKSENITRYMRAHYDIELVTEQWKQLFARMFAS